MMSSDWGFSTMRVILTALSVVSVATATTSFDYTPEEDHSSEFSFVPLLDRARRSPVEETRHADPSSIAATGGALSDASAALSRGFARDISEIVANVTDQKLREMTDITDKKLSEIAGKNNFTRGGDGEEDPDQDKYYSSIPKNFVDTFVDLDQLNRTTGDVKEHPMLSKSYRRAATIPLSFRFPFYGHEVANITIATGGFLYTGTYVHSWLAATQYIAPLMANFDTSQHEDAKIRYIDNGTALIVEWSNVHLQGKDSNNSSSVVRKMAGPFTFQALIRDDGDIAFSYKSVPRVIDAIDDEEHPVKVGLSDAYIIDRTIFYVRRKTIYEYHRVSLKDSVGVKVADNSTIYFQALETCNRKKSCRDCLGDKLIKDLNCKWCPSLQRCSDGVDRERQLWLKHNCDNSNIMEVAKCGIGGKPSSWSPYDSDGKRDDEQYHRKKFLGGDDHDYLDHGIHAQGEQNKLRENDVSAVAAPSSTHAGVAFVAMLCFLFAMSIAWFGYAYFFPHTWSGRLLIKYRPSRWHWFRSEPRYSAASIHM